MHRIIKWSCTCIALALACTTGFALGRQSIPESTKEAASVVHPADTDTLESFRTERQQLRQMQLSQLSEIVHSDNPDAEIVALAQQRQLELMEWAEKELTLEGVLSIRGFEDPVVTVHTDSVNVMLHAESVSQQEAAIILELVTRETGISGGNVKIIPVI